MQGGKQRPNLRNHWKPNYYASNDDTDVIVEALNSFAIVSKAERKNMFTLPLFALLASVAPAELVVGWSSCRKPDKTPNCQSAQTSACHCLMSICAFSWSCATDGFCRVFFYRFGSKPFHVKGWRHKRPEHRSIAFRSESLPWITLERFVWKNLHGRGINRVT